MIANERQYRIAKAQARKFEQAIAAARETESTPEVHPRVHDAMTEALESELAILREQVEPLGKQPQRCATGLKRTRIVRSVLPQRHRGRTAVVSASIRTIDWDVRERCLIVLFHQQIS